MRRVRKVTDELRAACFAASKDYPDGYYRAGDNIIRSAPDIMIAHGADADVGIARPANKWPQRTKRQLIVDGLAVDARLVAHVESATGPCRWARSLAPVWYPAIKGGQDALAAHVIIGFRGRKRVAIVAPLAPGIPDSR